MRNQPSQRVLDHTTTTVHTRLIITHAQTVTPINNTPINTTGPFLAHVKIAQPGRSAIFGSLASDGVYQSTTDCIHQTPLVTHAQTDTPISAMLYAFE